jgi:hypothetical protein
MTTKIYKVFLASPSDTKGERGIVENIVNDINGTLGEHHNFIVKVLKWETDTYPDFGEDGQDVINRQLGMDYDIFIGIMWKKFGTPTNRAESGTEEEFERAYEKHKASRNVKIMFYFNTAAIPQDQLDLKQIEKVQSFKKKVGELGGYYWSYDSLGNFEKDVRKHLQKHLLNLTTTTSVKNQSSNKQAVQKSLVPEINSNFLNYLDDPAATFSHSQVDTINLQDIYVAPDLKDLNDAKKTTGYKTINLEELTGAIDVDGIRYVIIGNESAGKTTAAKFLFRNYFNYGLLPILVKGNEFNNNIRTDAIRKIVESKIAEQYDEPFYLKDFHNDRFLIIIDDFHKAAKGNNKYWSALMANVQKAFSHVIVTGNTLMPVENVSRRNPFDNFKIFSILEFGPKLRSELVTKWYTLGIEDRFFDKNELLRKHDNAIAHIKTIMGKSYISAYPFYLLSMLQALESGNVQNPNYSIHGFYYELIINEAFSRAIKDKKEISLYYNYLTIFAFYLFSQDTKEVTLEEFNQFHLAYCDKHDLTYSVDTIIETFETAKLLIVNHRIFIKEKYVYYFFVAKYIANNISKPEIKEIVTKMIVRIFKDEYAAITMFVTHLSKDEFIIEELIKNAESLFSDIPPAKLEDDIRAINDMVNRLPDQVLELVEVDQKRIEELEEQEKAEREEKEKEFDTEQQNYDYIDLEADISRIDFLARLTLAVKTIDILGQVTKKHWGEIDGERKLELVLSTYNLGLRTLNVYLRFVQNNSKEIIEHLSELVIEKHIKDRFELKEAIEEATQDFIFKLCFMSSWGLTKRVSNSIGYDKLKNSFQKALAIQPSNAVKLIDLSIKLGYAGIPMDEVEEYKKEMEKSKLSFVILQNLVIDHMYMFDTKYQIKDQVCSILGISMKDQLRIDATSKVKKN